jgi:hypothetical protein
MRASIRPSATAALAVTALMTVPAGAPAAGVSRERAESVAKRAASVRVERFGMSHPPPSLASGL